ncbi:MAG: endonuclease domain-containing protein [Chitinophagaceae bacterium]|nr:endonuclease domain-containing protein [Chitinophagaceae bacterium]
MIYKNAKVNRKSLTEAENTLWNILRNRGFMELKFRRQHPVMSYIADFYCHELKLIIEVDGEYHFTPEQKIKDKIRTQELSAQSFHAVRFSNNEILFNLENSMIELTLLINRLKSFYSSPGGEGRVRL